MMSFDMTEADYVDAVFGLENPGRCVFCGDEAYGVEPDAREYVCESCGERGVYGLEELLMMDLINIT